MEGIRWESVWNWNGMDTKMVLEMYIFGAGVRNFFYKIKLSTKI